MTTQVFSSEVRMNLQTERQSFNKIACRLLSKARQLENENVFPNTLFQIYAAMNLRAICIHCLLKIIYLFVDKVPQHVFSYVWQLKKWTLLTPKSLDNHLRQLHYIVQRGEIQLECNCCNVFQYTVKTSLRTKFISSLTPSQLYI